MEFINGREAQFSEIPKIISGYLNRLKTLTRLIAEFNGSSEKVFLRIGSKLQSFLAVSGISTKLAIKITETISAEILQSGINELNDFLSAVTHFLQSSITEIRNDKHELQKILPNIEAITQQLNGFDKIVKHLRMLGVATKIESARLGSEDQGFYALAETVDKLSGLINEKAIGILKKSEVLIEELNKTIINLNRLEKDQNEQSESIIRNCRQSLHSFNQKYADRIIKSEGISVGSQKVFENINGIVQAIQFHDITRQRFEHVQQALNGIIEHIEYFLSNPDKSNPETLLATVHDVCSLQVVQLADSVDEFNKAVFGIIDNLNEVGKNISLMLAETSPLSDAADSSKNNSFKKVQDELEEIFLSLEKNIEIDNELSRSINAVVNIVEDLSKYVLEIENIGTEIEIIAINARVKAAHTGSNGSALGVLSETIQKFSVNAKSQTTAASQILNRINNDSKNLRISIEAGSYKEENEKMISSSAKVSKITSAVIEMEKGAWKHIDELQHRNSSLHKDIHNTIDEITIANEAQTVLEKLTGGLSEIIFSIAYNGVISTGKELNTHGLNKKYTMNTERNVHQAYIGKAVKESRSKQKEETNSASDSLGENVELF